MQIFAATKEKLLPAATAKRIFSVVAEEMRLVEDEFQRQVSSNIQVIQYLGDYLRSSGGKRVRPALLILSGGAIRDEAPSEDVIRLATVMELLHTATLVHDDIIDNADTRRNEASINARFGNQTAVLMGDWLYMSAFETSLRSRSLEILDILTRLTRKMTEGELIQLTMIGRLDISEEEYYDILKRKTAYLFAACCEIGAILGGATAEQQSALREYGMNLGVAFQLADDLLDFTADPKVLGKPAGADLIEGKLTLPLIYLLRQDTAVRAELEKIMYAGDYSEVPREGLLRRLHQYGILEKVRAAASELAEKARKNLEVLPKTRYRSALEEIPGYVVDRNG